MTTKFFLNPSEYRGPGLRDLDHAWSNISEKDIREAIVVQAQYLQFHCFLLRSLHYEWRKAGTGEVSTGRLGHSIRAGAVKAAVLLYVSIAEAAMRRHAEVRGYELPKNEKHRTFGKVLEAWESAGKVELEGVWDDLIKLRDHRNLAHLFMAAEERHDWRDALAAEEDLLKSGDRVLEVLRGLPPTKSPEKGGGGGRS